MANDYRVVLSGEDRLSGTIKNVRNELNNTGKAGTKLDEIKRKFERIQSSAAPLKSKLRELRAMMADMNLDGLSNTDVFGHMAEQAGQYADAIADAQQAVRALADDNMTKNDPVITTGSWEINQETYTVTKNDKTIALTPKEFQLLSYLVDHKGQVLNRDQLVNGVWGYDILDTSRIVDIHISHLRDKLEDDSQHPTHLLTVRGFGYKFV